MTPESRQRLHEACALLRGDGSCAMGRMCTLLMESDWKIPRYMFDTAERIGLSVSEAVGVMDGWDMALAAGKDYRPLWENQDRILVWRFDSRQLVEGTPRPVEFVEKVKVASEYWEGRQLGAELAHQEIMETGR